MQIKSAEATTAHVLPGEIRQVFGKPPLLYNEKAALYERLFSEIAGAIEPRDVVDWIWVKDVADLQWEVMRLRRITTLIIQNGRRAALGRLFRSAIDDGEVPFDRVRKVAEGMAHAAMNGEPDAQAKAKAELAMHGYDDDATNATAFVVQIETLETLHRLTAAAELRRDKVLREIEFRRETIGQRLCQIVAHTDSAPLLPGPADETSIQVPRTSRPSTSKGT